MNKRGLFHLLIIIIITVAIVVGVVSYLSSVRFAPERSSIPREVPPEPDCVFINLGQKIKVSPHIVNRIILECEESCKIDQVINIKYDGKAKESWEPAFLGPFSNPSSDDQTEIVALSKLLNSMDEGLHDVSIRAICEDGRHTDISRSFIIEHEKVQLPILKRKDESQRNELEEALLKVRESEDALFSPPSFQDYGFSDCFYSAQGDFPYFFTDDSGQMPATLKEDIYNFLLRFQIQDKLSVAINTPDPGGFSPLRITGGSVKYIQPEPPNWPVEPGWNQNGLATLVDKEGNFFGVGAPFGLHEPFYDFYDYVVNNVKQPDSVAIIFVDEIINEEGSSTFIDGYYDSVGGYIVFDINELNTFNNFVYQGFILANFTEEFIDILSHEIGHSFSLEHHNLESNLMFSSGLSAGEFNYAQSCQVRRKCNNLGEMFLWGSYGVNPDMGPKDTCNNNMLGSTDGGLDETCEFGFDGVDAAFPVNCTEDNPGVDYDFGGQWGAQHTPFACYYQLPDTDGLEGQCKVAVFCGNGILDNTDIGESLDLGEECDPEYPYFNHGCGLPDFICGNEDENINCICLCEEGEDKVNGCGGCCPDGEICNQDTDQCECPGGALPNGECELQCDDNNPCPNCYGCINGSCWYIDNCDDGQSCFLAGTLIDMADGTQKNIEDVKVGDVVLGYDEKRKKTVPSSVLELESPIREGIYNVIFEDGKVLKVTNEHPLYAGKYIEDKRMSYEGWASIEPEATLSDADMIVERIVIGDKLLTRDGMKTIVSLYYVKGEVQTYNLKRVSNTNTFFADGVLAHNKHGGDHQDPDYCDVSACELEGGGNGLCPFPQRCCLIGCFCMDPVHANADECGD